MSAKKAADTVKNVTPAKTSEQIKATEVSKESVATPAKVAAAKAAPAKEEKAPVKKTEVKEEKAPAKKAEAPKKAASKAAAKTTKTAKETVSQNVYVQFDGKEVKTEELVEQVKAIWTGEGHRASSIKSLEVYVKPEDAAAYYVINGKDTGKIEL